MRAMQKYIDDLELRIAMAEHDAETADEFDEDFSREDAARLTAELESIHAALAEEEAFAQSRFNV